VLITAIKPVHGGLQSFDTPFYPYLLFIYLNSEFIQNSATTHSALQEIKSQCLSCGETLTKAL